MPTSVRLAVLSFVTVALVILIPRPAAGAVGDLIADFPLSTGGSPFGLAHDGMGDLLITDLNAGEVSTITTAGNAVSTCGTPAGLTPTFVATDGAGRIWVTEQLSNVVTELDPNISCTPVGSFNMPNFPQGITYDSIGGNLFVTEFGGGAHRVQEVSPSGVLGDVTLLPTFGTADIAHDPSDGGFWIYANGDGSLHKFDADFNRLGIFPVTIAFGQLEGLAVVGDSCFLVASAANRLLEVFCEIEVFDDGFESGNTSAWSLTVP